MDIAGQIQQAIKDAAFYAANDAKDLLFVALNDAAPVFTGAVRDSIEIQEPGWHDVGVLKVTASVADEAIYTDQGTEPHEITPIGEGYPLRFYWENGPRGADDYSYMRVDHPGVEATFWWSDTLATWDDLLGQLL